MKRRIALLMFLCMLCLSVNAYADVPQLSGTLFSTAKQALVYLSSGEYERLVTLLPFSGVSPSASEWQSFADNFSSLSSVQTDYAVAYWTGSSWKVAVPVSEPNSDDVETLVLSSDDGASFSGYRYSSWSQVRGEYESASYVMWDDEYVDSDPVIAVD